MSYDGILNGATGLFYFIFTTHGKPLPTEKPEWWARVRAVSKELAKLRPVLENGEEMTSPVEVSAPLAAQTWAYQGYLYTVLLNRSAQTIDVPQTFLDKSYKKIAGSRKKSQIQPYDVWVLKKKVI